LNHSCCEFTHKYKETADVVDNIDPSLMVGMESGEITSGSRGRRNESDNDVDTNGETAPVKMVVLDGIMMGHTVSVV
jgi:hypothetical protein